MYYVLSIGINELYIGNNDTLHIIVRTYLLLLLYVYHDDYILCTLSRVVRFPSLFIVYRLDKLTT